MNPEQIIYAINVEDIQNVAEELEIEISDEDLPFLIEQVENIMGDSWYSAIENALEELKEKRQELVMDI